MVDIKEKAEIVNLTELKNKIDSIYKFSRNPDKVEVFITTSEQSIGGRAKCGIKAILQGIDWEHNQVRIEPIEKLIKYKEQTNDK